MGERATLSRPGPRRDPGVFIRAHGLEVALALPLVVYLLLLTAAPIVETVRLSLSAPPDGGFPSLGRYRALLTSDLFRAALRNTVIVVLLSLGLEIGLGLLLALTLHRRFPLRGPVRTLVLMPLGVPTVVSAAVMLLVFARSGYLNALLFAASDALGALGVEWRFEPMGWTVAGGWPTLFTVAVADTWKVLPVVTLILLAGLQAIPVEVEEAARADGATGWRWLRHVVLPLLAPYVTMAVILRAIDAFRIFEVALVLAGRVEPVLGTFIWGRYAPPASDPFTASAGAVVLFVLILGFVSLYLRVVAGRHEAAA
ncbi:MAG TPA: sugar ABC transporter permease [Methylomirabilota bacterium]|jgi:trehalose transport system permease protein